MNTAKKSSRKGSKTGTSKKPPSSETFVTSSSPVQLKNTGDLLTWLRRDSHARTSRLSVKELESRANTPGYGKKLPKSFASLDRNTLSWKTRQHLLTGGLETFSETWPEWGLMLDGECYQANNLAPHTSGNESGLLRTCMASDGMAWKKTKKNDVQGTISKVLGRGGTYRLIYAFQWKQYSITQAAAFYETMMGWPKGWTDCVPLETAKFQSWLRAHGRF